MKPSHVVSVRVDPERLTEIRAMAKEDGRSVSEWIRSTVWREVMARQVAPFTPSVPGTRICGWQCEHMSMTASGVTLGKLSAWCGCDMQPVYEVARPLAA